MSRSKKDTANEVDQLLDDLAESGQLESSDGTFTINTGSAHHKFAKFSLSNPQEFILKLVQAANLNATALRLEKKGSGCTAVLEGWDPSLSLEKLKELLLGSEFRLDGDALGYLFVGLVTLSKELPNQVQITQRSEGSSVVKYFQLDSELELTTKPLSSPSQNNTLQIKWPKHESFTLSRLREILEARCGFSKIPIRCGSKPLECPFPPILDSAERQYFPEPQTVAWNQAPNKEKTPNLKDEKVTPTLVDGDPDSRFTSLRLTTSLTKRTTIYFVKDGILLEPERFLFGLPGIVGVVNADNLQTDLSGLNVLKNSKLKNVRSELKAQSRELYSKAISDPFPLEPVRPKQHLVAGKPEMSQSVSLFLSLPFFFSAYGVLSSLNPPWIIKAPLALASLAGANFLMRFILGHVSKRFTTEDEQKILQEYADELQEYLDGGEG